MRGPTSEFWQERFELSQTPWDRGGASPKLLEWLAEGALKPCRILVPGCGSGWELVEFARRGFAVTGIDYTQAAVERSRSKLLAEGLDGDVRLTDVLDFQAEKPFDAIYEQTCLCALFPDFWGRYVAQLHRWLKPGGDLWILFMQVSRPLATSEGRIEGPPYHSDINAMRALFPEPVWTWPQGPLETVPHSTGWQELATRLVRV
ncbi:MAG: methyltransferase domain-containing protein [Burkholderiaceae bacterium]